MAVVIAATPAPTTAEYADPIARDGPSASNMSDRGALNTHVES